MLKLWSIEFWDAPLPLPPEPSVMLISPESDMLKDRLILKFGALTGAIIPPCPTGTFLLDSLSMMKFLKIEKFGFSKTTRLNMMHLDVRKLIAAWTVYITRQMIRKNAIIRMILGSISGPYIILVNDCSLTSSI